ncbi:hypothetical protein DIPPA_15674 [Diplonema papillatum]|nr:hypothetical protein DIPPA_19127 [Diplonema papillatum]KAJ9442855.1 hypothetical protein DIPPA_15674 [Diplonema papillatum]
MRVFGVSDIHVDYKENVAWLHAIDEENHKDDCIIVAGDVSHRQSLLLHVFQELKKRFRYVAFTPGNHDLWLDEDDACKDSLEKFSALMAMCDAESVIVRPALLDGKVWLVPIHAWHHQSWDREPDITGWTGIASVERLMADFRRCKWPAGMDHSTPAVAQRLDRANDDLSPAFDWSRRPGGAGGAPVISFSHFLPHPELCPEKRYLFHPNLPKAVGSDSLQARVRRVQSDVHLFGHTHFGWDTVIDGTRFVQCPLAYPHEREAYARFLRVGPPEDVEKQDPGTKPLLLWGEATGFLAQQAGWWSEFYKNRQRDPSNTTDLAPYVAARYKRVESACPRN